MAAGMGQQTIRQAFLWGLGAVYLFAFLSLYLQIPGLYGDRGIIPAHRLMMKEYIHTRSQWDKFLEKPTFLWMLRGYFELSAEIGMELICLLGALLAFLVLLFESVRSSLTFAVMWYLYYSLYSHGEKFMWFQWDILLLETGFLAIIVAPLLSWKKAKARHHDGITMWLVKWLLFRLMFASGVVKLTSRCPTWWDLTALNWHYESQCIPTPVAWYAHQLPEWFQKLSTVGTYVTEISVPFLFFAPVKSLRIAAFYLQIFFQLCIILTGNYNFFNLLTCVLCVSLLDDKYIYDLFGWEYKGDVPMYKKVWSKVFGGSTDAICRWSARLTTSAVMLAILYYIVKFFSIQVDLGNLQVDSVVSFTWDGFSQTLHDIMPWTIYMGVFSLAIEIVAAIYHSLSSDRTSGGYGYIWSLLQTVLFSGIAIAMFGISLIPHTVLDHDSARSVWPAFHKLYRDTEYLEITSSYGLFRRMTGVGGRPELVIEGSNDLKHGWKEYDFLYKPGDVYEYPPFVAPHQPRLDWQMWFAALGHYKENPWLVNLAYHLLYNVEPVLDLMGTNPFPDNPPAFIRITRYKYHYTPVNNNDTSAWWWREEPEEYLPVISKHLQSVREFLKHHFGMYYQIPKTVVYESDWMSVSVRAVRQLLHGVSPMPFLMSVFTAAVLLISTRAVMARVTSRKKSGTPEPEGEAEPQRRKAADKTAKKK